MTTKVLRKVILVAASVCAVFFVVPAYSGSKSGQTIETAASEYLAALADGTLDGYLAHEGNYRNKVKQGRASMPSAMWAQHEASLRSTAKAKLQEEQKGREQGGWVNMQEGVSNSCLSIVRRGATVKIQEIRQLSPDSWTVFYDVSYANQQDAPPISRTPRNARSFRSGVVRVVFKSEYPDIIAYADYFMGAHGPCYFADGTVTTWPVPPLSAEDALHAAATLPQMVSVQIRRVVTAGSPRETQEWEAWIEAWELLKSTFEKHGWTASGFETPSRPQSRYDGQRYFKGRFEPPTSAQKYVIRLYENDGSGGFYEVVLLEHAKSEISDLSVQEDKATATISTRFSGCTVFCDLWKEVRSIPSYEERLSGIFLRYNVKELYPISGSGSDFVGETKTKVHFNWTAGSGWRLEK